MAGEGSRFLKEGRTTPKQMINEKWQMTNDQSPILKANYSFLD